MKVAFVVQRYGLEVDGGAETLCRQIAEHLTPFHDVQVITSCALEYIRWKNHYPAGVEEINGIRVHRFPVDQPRNPRRFRRLTHRILSGKKSIFEQLEWMRKQGPYSTPLFDFIRSQRDGFQAFVFFTYLYPTSFFGLQLVPEKAAMVPAAHDEPFLFLDLFHPLFHLPRFLIYSTESEKKLVEETFSNDYIPSAVVGTGIEVPQDVNGDRFRQKYNLPHSFILYVGRIDNAKNCPEMFDFFIRYKREQPSDLKLVLMGTAVIPVPRHPDIVHLGFVSETDKFDGLAASSVLILPSRFESLSIVTLEAWGVETPVLVNGRCNVLRENCEKSGGGLYYRGFAEFGISLKRLLHEPDFGRRLGRCGAAFVAQHYNWPDIERQYLAILDRIAKR
jgi:glycosyltransferase involved in cell wall biosynthesis